MYRFNSIPTADLDMLWPETKPNPTAVDVLWVVVPMLIGLCTSVYKIFEVRPPSMQKALCLAA